jgi:hypothetical protein
MPRQSWVKRELHNICEYFDSSKKKIFKRNELRLIFTDKREEWSLPPSLPFTGFIEKLLDETELLKVQLDFPHRRETRYLWGDVSDFQLAQSLKDGSYITHQTAAYLHELIDVPPQNLFVNFEQSKRKQRGDLTQEAIDRAFQNPVRVTNNKATYKDNIIWIINGMHTGRYGVIEKIGEKNEKISVTNVARTLVDIAVRPVYAGGVSNVFTAYQSVKDKVTVEELSETLRNMGYIYPYHQVVGFYMENAGGVEEKSLGILEEIPMNYDFYLTHQMRETAYSKKWRLHYPIDLL